MLTNEAKDELARSVPADAKAMGPRHLLALAERVRARRVEQGWSQDELAYRAGVARTTYLRFERTGALPGAELCAVLHALGYRDALLALAESKDGETKERRRGRTSLSARVMRAPRTARPKRAATTKDLSSPRQDKLMPAVVQPMSAAGALGENRQPESADRRAVGPSWGGLDPALEAEYRGMFGVFIDDVVQQVIKSTQGAVQGRALAAELIGQCGLPKRAPVIEAIITKDLSTYARAEAGPRRVSPERFAAWQAKWR